MKILTVAKYIDQPVVLSKLHSKMPAVLGTVGAGVWGYETFHKKRGDKDVTTRAFKNAVTIGSTVGASLMAARGLKIGNKTLMKGLLEFTPVEKVLQNQTKAIDEFLDSKVVIDDTLAKTLKYSKNRMFTLKDIEVINKRMPKGKTAKEFMQKILPKPENIDSKEVFGEIKRLSLIGLIPVVGGVTGGIAADYMTSTNSKRRTANKIKEGIYQYLANIFLCNVGAGAALWGSEKLAKAKVIKPLTPVKKLGVILAGITATGIVGGSAIANYLSKKLINPLFAQKKDKREGLYSERKPEPLDVALHADDIATAGVLSGFKWIEPALPVMYFISGYRAGIGYRNNGQG